MKIVTTRKTLLKDITGQTFGLLTVVSRAENYICRGGQQMTQWNCVCVCGSTKIALGNSLKRGVTQSCGCLLSLSKRHNLLGTRFGKLVVISRASDYTYKQGRTATRWNCECDCGRVVCVWSQHLTRSKSARKSCGCDWLGNKLADTHFVYEMYDSSNNLLYVGITVDFKRRMAQHSRNKSWFKEVSYIESELVLGRTAALELESELVSRKNPMYNVVRRSEYN